MLLGPDEHVDQIRDREAVFVALRPVSGQPSTRYQEPAGTGEAGDT
jgi:hypothetical protein